MKTSLFAIILLLTGVQSIAQDRFDKVEIIIHEVTENVYMLEGSGGNILIQVDVSQVVMIDSQFAPLSDKIIKAIKTITDKPITYLINTHHHGDHTGGNKNFNTEETTLIASKNVWKRLSENENEKEFLPEKIVEEEYHLILEANNNIIVHVHNAHTDGDSFVYLTDSNVVHMGDILFKGRYPYIDIDSGGSISGYIAAQKQILNTINKDTKIIPGHGTLANYEDLATYIPMLEDLKNQIEKAIKKSRSRDQVKQDVRITRAYDEKGFGKGFISSEKIRTTIYDSLILEATSK